MTVPSAAEEKALTFHQRYIEKDILTEFVMGLITIANIHFKSREKSDVKILEIYLLNPAYSSSETLKVNAQIAS